MKKVKVIKISSAGFSEPIPESYFHYKIYVMSSSGTNLWYDFYELKIKRVKNETGGR